MNLTEVCHRVAQIHGELIAIHPFREGNGRTARWLADMMLYQAGYPAAKYDIDARDSGKKRQEYYAAIRKAVFDRDQNDLRGLFEDWVRAA